MSSGYQGGRGGSQGQGQGGGRGQGQGGGRGRGGSQRSGEPQERQRGELQENVVKIKRCAAVVKGGRRFSFAAMVVVGNGHGKVGWGYGKANEVPPSVEKASKEATRQQIEVARDGQTIPQVSAERLAMGASWSKHKLIRASGPTR